MRHVWSPLRAAEQQQIVNTLNHLAALRLLDLFWLRCLRGRGSNGTSGFFYIVDASDLKVFTFSNPCVFKCWWDTCRGVLLTTMIQLATCASTHSSLLRSLSLSAPVRFDLSSLHKCKAVAKDMTLVFKWGALWTWVWVHSSFMFQSSCTFPKAFIEIIKSVTSVLLDSRRVLKKTLQWLLANGNVIRKMLNMYFHNVLFYEGTSTMTTARWRTFNR